MSSMYAAFGTTPQPLLTKKVKPPSQKMMSLSSSSWLLDHHE